MDKDQRLKKGNLRGIVIETALLPVHFYRACISPLFPPSCRYTPTCSEYALQALRQYGVVRGSLLAARRICRCHPWGGSGYDPVPPARQTPDTKK